MRRAPVLVAVLLAACGSSPGRVYRPVGPRSRRVAQVPEEHHPAADLAPIYEAAARGAQHGGLVLAPDAALEAVAKELLPTVGDDGQPPHVPVVEFVTRWHGLLDPQPMVLYTEGRDVPEICGRIEGLLAESTPLPHNRIGVALEPVPGGYRSLVLVTMRYLQAEPANLVLQPGGTFRIAGKLLPPFQRPRVVVTSPDGQITEMPLPDARDFVAQIAVPRAGRYDFEVVGESDRGIMVLANFPLYVGVDPPSFISMESAATGDTDSSEVEEALFEMVNEARTKHGMPALERRADLDRVARAHDADMVENDFLGHTSPTTGDPTDRVSKAGFVSGLVFENIAREYSARGLHEGLMRSPGHRANILQPDVTHVGIGVVAVPEGARTALIATEVFMQLARDIDPADAEARFAQVLGERRRRVGVPPVEVDRELSNVARTAARRYFRERMTRNDLIAAVTDATERFDRAYRQIGLIVSFVTTVDDPATIEQLLERDMTVVGVGIAQGDHPAVGPNAIAVVVVTAWPR